MKSAIRALTNQILERHAVRMTEPNAPLIDQRYRPALPWQRSAIIATRCDLSSLATVAFSISDPDAERLAAMVAEFKITSIPPQPFADDEQGAA
ncbi:hypothetical protein [Acerihabitans arboris]|uniref:Uncharacterized protein n=1 Tax=Acerihabitans arboris TaxID=2691583 RepID=A0A845SIS1_9GAMM|nr:hypothetical protein [Acerihabitans arboris]NDL64810.1 hypothetical protein [Acerihabitans arboris]